MAEEKNKTAKKADDKKDGAKKAQKNKNTAKKTSAAKSNKTQAEEKSEKQDKKTDKSEEKEAKFFEYKGKPLVRSKNNIYYGDLNDPYVVYLSIKSEKEVNGEKIADDVQVQLLSTDETLSPKDRVIRKSDKKGLFTALDLGDAWLNRHLRKG